MKKILALLSVVFCIVQASAQAENLNYQELSTEQLRTMLDGITEELNRRNNGENIYLFDEDGFSGEITETEFSEKDGTIFFTVVLHNKTEDYATLFYTPIVNGWEVGGGAGETISAKSNKANGQIEICKIYELAQIKSLDEIVSLELDCIILLGSSSKTIRITFSITPNKEIVVLESTEY